MLYRLPAPLFAHRPAHQARDDADRHQGNRCKDYTHVAVAAVDAFGKLTGCLLGDFLLVVALPDEQALLLFEQLIGAVLPIDARDATPGREDRNSCRRE